MPDTSWFAVLPAGLSAWLAWRADQRYRRLPRLPPAGDTRPLPSLSIVIPARDEAATLPRLLDSLDGLRYPGELEVIVVDDGSRDGTGDLARERGARVLLVEALPPGWSGKPHACHQGARIARGEWLLFTDADTVHAPDGPARAVACAMGAGLDGVSLMLRQEAPGRLEQAALSTAFAGLFAWADARKPLLNGQFILLRREVYERSGGFGAVRAEPLEDLALGQHLRARGYQVPLLWGESAGQVRMYPDLQHLARGLSRLAAGSLRWSTNGGWLSVLLVGGAATPVLVVGPRLARREDLKPGLAAWLVVVMGFAAWARRMGSAWTALLAPVGALIVLLSALGGLLRQLMGLGFTWKDRQVGRGKPWRAGG